MTPFQSLFIITTLINVEVASFVTHVLMEIIGLDLLKLLDIFDDFDHIKFRLNFFVPFVDEPFELMISTAVRQQAKRVTTTKFQLLVTIFVFQTNVFGFWKEELVDCVNLEAYLGILAVDEGAKHMKNTRNTTNLASNFPDANNFSTDFVVEMTKCNPFNKDFWVVFFMVVHKSGTNQFVLLPESVLVALSKLNPINDICEMAQSKIEIQVLNDSKLQRNVSKELNGFDNRRSHISMFEVQIDL